MHVARTSITETDVLDLFEKQGGLCYWLGVPLVPSGEPRDPQKPSIDRLDASNGYVSGNVVLTCQFANMGRNIAPAARFRQFLAALAQHFPAKVTNEQREPDAAGGPTPS